MDKLCILARGIQKRIISAHSKRCDLPFLKMTISGLSDKEAYAFVSWIFTIVAYGIFLLWAYLPDDILHSYGVTYYPSKYYAISIPAYMIVLYFLLAMVYVGLNMMITPAPEEMCTIRDTQAPTVSSGFVRCSTRDGIPDSGDIDPRHVSRLLAAARLGSREW